MATKMKFEVEQPHVTTANHIEFDAVSHSYGSGANAVQTLDNVSLRISKGEVVAIIGPSGCGKSTMLNLLSGLAGGASGRVTYGGTVVDGPNTRVGYMTQQDSVLPWRTVRQNIDLPLEIRGVPKAERGGIAAELISLVKLSGFDDSFPSMLSGGMRKRLGLAQILASDPETLLLDEPFGALDAMLRVSLHSELAQLIVRRNWTTVLVTHDIGEALTLADRVVVMSARPGRIVTEIEVDLPHPRDPATIRFADRFVKLEEQIWQILDLGHSGASQS